MTLRNLVAAVLVISSGGSAVWAGRTKSSLAFDCEKIGGAQKSSRASQGNVRCKLRKGGSSDSSLNIFSKLRDNVALQTAMNRFLTIETYDVEALLDLIIVATSEYADLTGEEFKAVLREKISVLFDPVYSQEFSKRETGIARTRLIKAVALLIDGLP